MRRKKRGAGQLFSSMNRIPRKLALFLTGFAGIFGIRTPPDPEVVAQMQPARPSSTRREEPVELEITPPPPPTPPP